jgi:N-acetylglucosamine-6-sulfatase
MKSFWDCGWAASGYRVFLTALVLTLGIGSTAWGDAEAPQALKAIPGAKPRNIVFILTDDHRFDALGFLGHPFLKTPNLDRLARGGAHFANAFVTTSLCSPSRASILTGHYAHRHRVVDNNNPVPPGTIFFPQYLQKAGYETAFIGKWHMGSDSDAVQPGFDHWVSFRGQGTYLPNPDGLNVNGKRVSQKGYITDELTDYAVDWLRGRQGERPFFLYLSHKAVHVDLAPDKEGKAQLLIPGNTAPREFIAAPRHKGRYRDAPFTAPRTMADSPEAHRGRPMWVRNQRNSVIGVDYPFYSRKDLAVYYRQYCETLLAVDESVGRLLDLLREKNLLDSTLVVYMGDNGYAFGEHGLIDKRTAYEESMRIPMLLHCPDLITSGRQVTRMVANIDVAPTLLEAAGLKPPDGLDGRSFLPLARGQDIPWRGELIYEYFWERNLPMTPTLHALRVQRYKFIRCYGLWDTDELYDLREDPAESRNLIDSPDHQTIARDLRQRLFLLLEQSSGLAIPLSPDHGLQQNQRSREGARPADFPTKWVRD